MSIVIIKYNAGNIFSVKNAIARLGVEAIVTDDHNLIKQADKVIFPGVGEASSTMAHMQSSALDMLIKELKQPVLGICLGMQLMCKNSEEGRVDCLGIFDVPIKRFVKDKHENKVPHMGWNTIYDLKTPLFSTVSPNEYVYYVHSFYAPVCNETIATTNYIEPFSGALHKDNYYATQFHPEKSGDVGERILKQFLEL